MNTNKDEAHIRDMSHISKPIYGEMIKKIKQAPKWTIPMIKSSLLSILTTSQSSQLSGSLSCLMNNKRINTNSMKPAHKVGIAITLKYSMKLIPALVAK